MLLFRGECRVAVLGFNYSENWALGLAGADSSRTLMSRLTKRLNSVFVFVLFLFSCTRLAFTRIWPFQQSSQTPPSVKVFALTEAAWLELRTGGGAANQDKSASKSGDDKKEAAPSGDDKKGAAPSGDDKKTDASKSGDCDKGGSKSGDDKKGAAPSGDDKKTDAAKSGDCDNSGPGGGDGDTGGSGG